MKRIVTSKALTDIVHVQDLDIGGMEIIFAFNHTDKGPKVLMLKRNKEGYFWVTLGVGFEWGMLGNGRGLEDCIQSAHDNEWEIFLFENLPEALSYCSNFLNEKK